MATDPTIFVVDDDEGVRRALEMLLSAADFRVEAYASAEEFLAAGCASRSGCLVADLNMPGISGQELLERLVEAEADISVLVLTGYGDVPSAVRAIKAGAVDFIEKPVKEDVLLEKVRDLYEKAGQHLETKESVSKIAARINGLTPREHQIMELVTAGYANKAIAERLGISRRTVEAHRARVMEKMQAETVTQLVRMALAVDNASLSKSR